MRIILFILLLKFSNFLVAADPSGKGFSNVPWHSQNDSTHWSIDFYHEDETVDPSEFVLNFEVFVNGQWEKNFSSNNAGLNILLADYAKKLDHSDFLELLFLNSEGGSVKLGLDEFETSSNSYEVHLIFPGKAPREYSMVYAPRKDFYFFYVEKSGGIHNLRYLRNLTDPVVNKGHYFLMYFNALGNPFMTSNQASVMAFYNLVFTEITQPPQASAELKRVISALQGALPADMRNIDLHYVFFLSEISYRLLGEDFIGQLTESFVKSRRLFPKSVTIATDFNVSNKNKNFKYINLSENF
jgi:hypothetical protein